MFAHLASTSARALMAKAKGLRSCVRVEPRPFNFKMVSLFGWKYVKVTSLLIEYSSKTLLGLRTIWKGFLFSRAYEMELSVPLHVPVSHFASPIEYTSVSVTATLEEIVLKLTWCSIWMAVLRSGVQAESQTSALLSTGNKAVEPLCEFIFFDLRCNVISCLVPFWCSFSGWMSRALGDGQLGVN